MCMYTKFHANRTILFGEVIKFHKFSRWRPPRSRDITICNSGQHTKSTRWSELAVRIWFRNLDYFWIYRNFSILSRPLFGEFWGLLPPKFNSHYSDPVGPLAFREAAGHLLYNVALHWLTRCGPKLYSGSVVIRRSAAGRSPATDWTRSAASARFFCLLQSHPSGTLYWLTLDCERAFPLSSATWKPICLDSLSPPVLQSLVSSDLKALYKCYYSYYIITVFYNDSTKTLKQIYHNFIKTTTQRLYLKVCPNYFNTFYGRSHIFFFVNIIITIRQWWRRYQRV